MLPPQNICFQTASYLGALPSIHDWSTDPPILLSVARKSLPRCEPMVNAVTGPISGCKSKRAAYPQHVMTGVQFRGRHIERMVDLHLVLMDHQRELHGGGPLMRVALVQEAIKEGAGVLEKGDCSQGRRGKKYCEAGRKFLYGVNDMPATYVALDEVPNQARVRERDEEGHRRCGRVSKYTPRPPSLLLISSAVLARVAPVMESSPADAGEDLMQRGRTYPRQHVAHATNKIRRATGKTLPPFTSASRIQVVEVLFAYQEGIVLGGKDSGLSCLRSDKSSPAIMFGWLLDEGRLGPRSY